MKKYFITGLLVLVPLVITVWVFMLVINTMDNLLPAALRPDAWFGQHIPGLGLVLTVALVFLTGVFAANFLGQQLIEMWEGMLARIPVVKSIYGGVKQVSDTVFASDGKAFRKAVLVRFPHNDAWTIAFVTGEPGAQVARHLPADCVNVYVPTTPNPTSGYFLIVAKKDLVELDMRVDTALKYVLSMGSVAAANQQNILVQKP
jgi:uncharacterized membrane protein